MLYWIFEQFNKSYDLPGAGMFQSISFRSAIAIITSLLIAIYIGKYVIRALKRRQIKDEVRQLGLDGENQKKNTPTMGGIIVLCATLIPTLLFAQLNNIYILLLIVATVWCGIIGFMDDYIKVFKHNKEGLKGRTKIIGQIGLGIIVGSVMCFSQEVVVHDYTTKNVEQEVVNTQTGEKSVIQTQQVTLNDKAEKATKTTIPFIKDNELDYSWFVGGNNILAWVLYVLLAIFVIAAVSNGANLTDGLDGLLTGVSIPIVAVLGVLAYLSGHILYADYLNIMYIPNSGELFIFAAAMLGALIGFLWYNAYPAQVFMGDTGSLAIGGIIATFALCIRKELLLPLMCGIFLVEALSVILQTSYFKYTRRKYGEGRRIFIMAPIHHHYQKKHMFETKIMMRFMIISILLAAMSLITLKIR